MGLDWIGGSVRLGIGNKLMMIWMMTIMMKMRMMMMEYDDDDGI